MRLLKLELHGFKSFAKKTEVLFDEGVTAIVGPNGSGKSNISDAIRWVLGEQSAKMLRGARMEDVIFGGTATRKPLSYCEVTLVFDNSDNVLPIDYAEVSITRRVYRSGESEYCINNSTCRLKDIHELFRDTGLGKEGYSFVGQGKVDEILSNRSGERRKAFEEAAGIMRYRVKKEEAERTLVNTRNNITRLGDILRDLEERLEPLEEQSTRAQEYLRLRDELRELEINLFLYQYDKIVEKLRALEDTVLQLSREIEELEAAKEKTSEECSRAEDSERAVSTQLNDLQTELVSATAGLESSLGDVKVINERLANSERERAQLTERIEENQKRMAELEAALSTQGESSTQRETLLDSLRTQLSAAQSELEAFTAEIEDKNFEVESLKNAMIDALNKMSDAKSQVSHLTTLRASLISQLESMGENEARIQAEIDELAAEEHAAADEMNEAATQLQTEDENLSGAVAVVNEKNSMIDKLNVAIRQAEQTLENKRSRLNVLNEMKKAHEGYYNSVRRLLQDCERDKTGELNDCIDGVVAEIIQVPEEYEDAIEMSLGNALQNIVSPDDVAAKKIIEHLKRNGYGRATILPVTKIQQRNLNPEERRYLRVQGCYGVASELVSCDPYYKNIVSNLLGRTVIVENLDVGLQINRASGQTFKIATLGGDIINPGGSMTGGSLAKKEYSLLGRERECAELLQNLDSLKKQLVSLREKLQTVTYELNQVNNTVTECTKRRHSAELRLAQHRDKVSIIRQQLDKAVERKNALEAEREKIGDSIASIDEQMTLAEAEQTELADGRVTTQADIQREQAVLNKMRAELAAKNESFTELKVRIASLEKEGDALRDEQKRLNHELSAVIATIEYDRRAITQLLEEEKQLVAARTELESSLSSSRFTSDELTQRRTELEVLRSKLLDAVDAARTEKERIESELTDKRERLHKQELQKSRSEIELASMQDKIWEDYELTYENAQVYRREFAVGETNRHADELRRGIKALGDININSIEEYKAISERYTSEKEQFDDLQKAEADLTALIEQLTTTMERLFREKFKLIRENFQTVFVELFSGGAADLILADESDILNCDIDILAQIPGKKLQTLTPLSGGERALTAIALQFAILKLKPTAFCLMDEIDAALDDANVTRFAHYIHRYSDRTQFILITHKKGSMEACNTMYGVSQEEKGVSSIYSARLNELTEDNYR